MNSSSKWWWPRVEDDICAGKTFGPGSSHKPGPKAPCQGSHGCGRRQPHVLTLWSRFQPRTGTKGPNRTGTKGPRRPGRWNRDQCPLWSRFFIVPGQKGKTEALFSTSASPPVRLIHVKIQIHFRGRPHLD